MHDIAPILDIEIPVNSVDESLPTAVASLVMQASLEEWTEDECLRQKFSFLLSDLDDLVALYVHKRTHGLFRDKEECVWSALSKLQLIASDMKEGRVQATSASVIPISRSSSRLSKIERV